VSSCLSDEAVKDAWPVVGIDLHRRRTVVVWVAGDGRKLETSRITNSPQALRREIAKAGDRQGGRSPRREIAKAGEASQVVVEAAFVLRRCLT
jgi:hypothetical protein